MKNVIFTLSIVALLGAGPVALAFEQEAVQAQRVDQVFEHQGPQVTATAVDSDEPAKHSGGYEAVDQVVPNNKCESVRLTMTLGLIEECKGSSNPLDCVKNHEDELAKAAYADLCRIEYKSAEEKWGAADPFHPTNMKEPCECQNFLSKVLECGITACPAPEPSVEPTPAPPSKVQTPSSDFSPALSGSGCSLGTAGVHLDALLWMLVGVSPALRAFRRRK